MKMLPVQLSLNPQMGLWSDVLWRCPPAPPSQLAELKTQLPASLPSDPRLWSREDVLVFLRFCEREFDLPEVDYDLFQMNGKALCLLTRTDFGHRCPRAGDVLHNVLQMLVIESHMMQWHLPNSPVTPTSRYPLSPHSHPPTPTWPPIAPPESPFHNAAHMHHFMPPNSVTLSPPPSVDSQASSPPQGQQDQASGSGGASGSNAGVLMNGSNGGGNNGTSSSNGSSSSGSSASAAFGGVANGANTANSASASSNQSDSDEETYAETAAAAVARNIAVVAAQAAQAQYNASPPTTPILKEIPQSLTQQLTNNFVSWTQSQGAQKLAQTNSGVNGGGSVSAPTTPSYMQPVKREFFPETTEPNTNGRLLWDFLQQLLNDRNQKYSDLIAWKCRDTGVFKIVDPAGLAKLWGIQKNHLSMNYDKMSRALRYYYRVNILRKVQGERHCYQFLRNPTELKNIKNISLLRQSASNSGTNNSSNSNASGSNNTNGNSSNCNSSSSTSAGNNGGGANWSLPHQSMNASLQHAAAAAAAAAQQHHQQQQHLHQQQQQHSPQRPASRSSNGSNLNLPTNLAVAAAAAAAYGPPPSSPLFMHAFHYLSNNPNAGPPPNSPAANLPPTPSEKFQFTALKMENPRDMLSGGHSSPNDANSEDMKPTDLSVAGSSTEKRPYSSPAAASATSSSGIKEECYPLIRNADGLTTIKLVRYNDNEHQGSRTPPASPLTAKRSCSPNGHEEMQALQQDGPQPMDSDCNSSESSTSNGQPLPYPVNLMATDLRK